MATDDDYGKILNDLIPHIAHLADKNDGLINISQVQEDKEVRSFLATIPEQNEKRLAKIIAKYGDYFAILEGGYIATYKAYETGRVDQNNNVVDQKTIQVREAAKRTENDNDRKIKDEEKRLALADSRAFDEVDIAQSIDYKDPTGTYQAQTMLNVVPKNAPDGVMDLLNERERVWKDDIRKQGNPALAPIIMDHVGTSTMERALAECDIKDENGNDMTLTDAVDAFYQCIFNDDSYEFFTNFMKVRKLRNGLFGTDDHDNLQSECGIRVNAAQFAKFGHVKVFPHRQRQLGGQQLGQPIDAFIPFEDLTRQEHAERNTLVLREVINQLFKLQSRTSTMVTLSQHPKVMALKKGVITKLTSFFDQHGDKFMRYTNPNGATKSECIELIMTDQDVAKFMEDTQDLHDDYLQKFPEIMTAEPCIQLQPSKKKRKKANREAREWAAKAREAGVDLQ